MSFIKAAQIDESLLQKHLSARYCRDYQQYADEFIGNVQTDLYLWQDQQQALVCSSNVSRSQTAPALSYVVSPYCAYVEYCLVEIARIKNLWITWPLVLLVKTLGVWLRAARIDCCLQINNWLLSTNLYPDNLQKSDLHILRDQAINQFPQQTLVFRSLNQRSNQQLIKWLKELKFIAVPSRQVYFFDARAGEASSFTGTHNFLLDQRALRKTSLQWRTAAEFTAADFERAAELYSFLYLEKYCQHNPAYTAHWLRAGHESGWLRLQGLVDESNQLQAILGWFENDELMTAPIVGYNTALPKKMGIYRLLTQACLNEAIRQKKILNFSAGAAQFKRLRGGEPEIEYSLIYIQHLNIVRRVTWRIMAFLLNHLAVPLMKKRQL
jgi:hypothetical protein